MVQLGRGHGHCGIARFLAVPKLTRRSVLSIPEQYSYLQKPKKKKKKTVLDRVGSLLFKAFICHTAPTCLKPSRSHHDPILTAQLYFFVLIDCGMLISARYDM